MLDSQVLKALKSQRVKSKYLHDCKRALKRLMYIIVGCQDSVIFKVTSLRTSLQGKIITQPLPPNSIGADFLRSGLTGLGGADYSVRSLGPCVLY